MKSLSLPAMAMAAAVLTLSAPVCAQDYGRDDDPAMRGAPPPGRGYGGAQGADQGRAGGPQALHAALRLRPDQDAAWQALNAQTAPDPQRAAQARDDASRFSRMTTPDRLIFTQQHMQRDAEEFARSAVAIRGFYAQLTPAQKIMFDRLTGPGGGRGDQGQPPRY